MSIKTKLSLSALSELLLIIIFSTFLVTSSRHISYISTNESKATEIVKSITEIRFVTFENLLHHDKRSYDQWQAKHTKLATQLSAFPAASEQEKTYIENIRRQHKAIGPIFSKLYASYAAAPPGQNVFAQNEYQERLASQLVSKQQIEITEAFKLANLKVNEVVASRQQSNSVAIAIIFLMFLITTINFLFVFSSISRALTILQRGSREIAKGKLDYRIKYKRPNDEFGRLASTFNYMAASVEQLDKIKSEFVLLVSHQLRTPATAVKGFISLFQDHYSDNLSPKQRELLASAYEENEREIKLINEILAVAQFDTGEMMAKKQPSDLFKIAKSVIAEQQMVFDARNQQANVVQASVLPEIEIDPEKIRIVIENLVNNASKFSPQGSQILVRLHAADSTVYVDIQDQGPGLNHAEQDKLFKKFSHVSNPSTVQTEGAGLGLYLSKKIVELHHGKITVASKVGEGTTFTVQLPI